MAAMQKDPVLVVVQLTGGNDYLNTVVPYNNPLYRDNRKAVGIVCDGPLLGARAGRAWARGAADAGAIREGVHQAQ